MSEETTPSISISELATTLRAAITAEQQLTLHPAMLGDPTIAAMLFSRLKVTELDLFAASVTDIAGGLELTGRASFLSLPELDLTLSVTASGGAALKIKLRASVPSGGARPNLGSLTALVDGQSLVPGLPDGLSERVALRDFELWAGPVPYVAITLTSTQPWSIIPDVLSLDSVELTLGVLLSSAPRIKPRIQATLNLGGAALPITLAKNELTNNWDLRMDAAAVALPGLTGLAQFFGDVVPLEAMMPGLGSFGGLLLTAMQLSFNPTRHKISSLYFQATTQQDWPLPIFGDLVLQRPLLSFGIDGLDPEALPPIPVRDPNKMPSGRPRLRPAPYLSFRFATAQSWELIPQVLRLDGVLLSIGVTPATGSTPRRVDTRIEATLQLDAISLPITLSKEASSTDWVLGLEDAAISLPGLGALAGLFGGADQLEAMMPGLGSFGAIVLRSLKLRIDLAHRTVSSLSFSVAAKNDWQLPLFDELALRKTTVALSIANPLSSTRATTGNVSAEGVVSGLAYQFTARKDAPTTPWRFDGQQIVETPISLTAVARDMLGGTLPAEVPEFSFSNVMATITPASGEFSLSGQSAARWTVPLGFADFEVSNLRLELRRRIVAGAKKMSLQVGGDFSIGGVTASLALTLPGGFALSATLPPISLSNILNALGAGAVLQGLGLSSSFFNLALGETSLTIDATAKSVSLISSATDFAAIELHVRRDARGALGAAMAFSPKAGVNLQTLLNVPGLGGLTLTDLAFVLSSLQDPDLRFSAPAFAKVGRVTRGFGFAAKVALPSFIAAANLPGLSSPTLAMQARFGRSLADFTLSAALDVSGGRIMLGGASGVPLIDPELRFSPGSAEFSLVGKTELVLEREKLTLTAGLKLSPGSARLIAEMDGEWRNPFGMSGVIARDLAMGLQLLPLPGAPELSGGLQVGSQSGSLMIRPSPTEPVLKLHLDNLDLHDLIASVGAPALASLPASVRQTLCDVRISNADLYVAPKQTMFGSVSCPPGLAVRGELSLWGMKVDGYLTMVKDPAQGMQSLQAEGLITLPDLGGLLVLTGGSHSGPYFKLDLQVGKIPVVIIDAAIEVLGARGPSVEIQLDDSGFRGKFSGNLMNRVRGTIEVSGGRFEKSAKYAIAVELDASAIGELLSSTQETLTRTIGDALTQLKSAEVLFETVKARGFALAQAKETQRREIQDKRDADAQRMRDAERELQSRSAQVDALLGPLQAARAQVQAERDEVTRRINAARSDVHAAESAVNSLNHEINATDRWFHGLKKIDVPWEPSQAREGVWFGLKMAGLYTARDTSRAGLDIANRALQCILDTQQKIPIDVDPRVAALLGSYLSAQAALQATRDTIAGLRRTIQLIPIDADFRMVALKGLQDAQNLQLIAAQAAFEMARDTLTGISSISSAFVPSVTIKRAYFSGELSALQSGVRLGLEVMTAQGLREFTIACDLKDPLKSVPELINRLLGTDAQKAIAAVQKSNAAATDTVNKAAQAGQDLLPNDAIVNLRCVYNNQLVRVVGKNLLRFGDTVSLRTANGSFFLVAKWDGTTAATSTSVGDMERFVLSKPGDHSNRDFVRYSDMIDLFGSNGRYLVAESNGVVNINREAVGPWEQWRILSVNNPNSTAEVDTSEPIALFSHHGWYLHAWDGGGSRTGTGATAIGYWEKFTIQGPDRSANSYCLVARGSDGNDAACQFRIKRSGDWLSFQSVKHNQFISIKADTAARADTTNFADVNHTWEHFRYDNGGLLNQGQLRYLHWFGAPANHPQFLDGSGTNKSEVECLFEIVKVNQSVSSNAPSALMTSGSSSAGSSSPAPAASVTIQSAGLDATLSSDRKSALSGGAAAGAGVTAERSANQQASQLRAGGESAVASDRLTVAQSEEDRRARRARAIEKAARGPRDATENFRDGALRFDGKSHLEAPASRAALREISTTASALAALPVDTIVAIRSQSNAQLVQVLGKNLLRYGDTLALRSQSGHYVGAEADNTTNANRTTISEGTRWRIKNPDDVSSTDFVRYGDAIALLSYSGKYLAVEWNDGTNAAHPLDDAARWTLRLAADLNKVEEVDTSQKIVLFSCNKKYFGATNGGGSGTSASDVTVAERNAFLPMLQSAATADFCMITRFSDLQNQACQFRLKRDGEWSGLQSVKSGQYVSADSNMTLCAASTNFAGAEHFGVNAAAIFNQTLQRSLRLAPKAESAPQFVDCAGSLVDAPEAAFEFVKVADSKPVRGTSSVQVRPIIELGSQFTIEAWICPEAIGPEPQGIISKWQNNEDAEVMLQLTADGRLALAWHVQGVSTFGAPGWTSCQSNEPIKLDAWSHVAAVRDGDKIALYIDGRQVGGAQGLGTAPLRVGAASWRIGAQADGANGLVGLIDSVRMWSTACSAALLRGQRYLVSRGDEAGLLACWNFDEESGDTAFDAGPRELHARLLFSVRRVCPGAPEGPPLPDRHLTLSGNAQVVIGEFDLFAGSSAMTIEAWIRVDQIDGDNLLILHKWGQGTDDEFLFAVAANRKLQFGWRTQSDATGQTFSSNRNVPVGRWTHVAVVRDGRTICLYWDGNPDGVSDDASVTPLRRGAVPIHIGGERGGIRQATGSIAELRVWRRALTADEIRENHRRPLSGDEVGLTGLWRLDEGFGTMVRDATPFARHGTLVGPISWPARGGPPRVVGPTRGMQFSGGQHLTFGDADTFTPSVALTVESWIRVDSITEHYSSIVNKWKAVNEYLFGLMPNQKLVFTWRTQGTGGWGSQAWGEAQSSTPITLNRWTHVAVVRAGRTVSFFIDGQLAGSSDVVDEEPFVNSTAPLHIGGESGGAPRYLRGAISSLRIWRTARTAEQLAASMAGLVSSRAPGRILDLRFDEGEGTTVLDAASGRLGQVVGSPLPSFIAVTLPVRSAAVIAEDPYEIWLQPALEVARHSLTLGRTAAEAIPEVDAALSQLERSEHSTLIWLLARAGYRAEAIGAAAAAVWAHDAAQVARQFGLADLSAKEALLATYTALGFTTAAAQVSAIALLSAADYTPESIGAALVEVWGHDPLITAKQLRDAGLSTTLAARAVWTVLARQAVPCFAALVEKLLAAGHSPADVGQALSDHWGCDPTTIARAVLRSGGSAATASAAAAAAGIIPTTVLRREQLREVKCERSNARGTYNFSTRSAEDAAAAGFTQQFVAFVAYATPQWGTIPIYRETPIATPGTEYHFWNRTAAEAALFQWKPVEVAFYAFATQVPGTVPVYREEGSSRYFFSVRAKEVATLCGSQQLDVAFYAYPPDTLSSPRTIALQTYGGQYVHLDTDEKTLVAKRAAAGGWESYAVIDLGQNRVALRARNGKYVSAENGGGGKLFASAETIGRNEAFLFTELGHGSIALQASNGQYWSSDVDAGGVPLQANRSVRIGLETFALIKQPNEFDWQTISGLPANVAAANVSAATDGAVWGVSTSGQIFQWDGSSWTQMPGILRQISVGSKSQIWGVTSGGAIFRWNGTGWDQIDGNLSHVSVAADGSVWGVNSNGAIL